MKNDSIDFILIMKGAMVDGSEVQEGYITSDVIHGSRPTESELPELLTFLNYKFKHLMIDELVCYIDLNSLEVLDFNGNPLDSNDVHLEVFSSQEELDAYLASFKKV